MFTLSSVAAYTLSVALARLVRSRAYAIFIGVLLGLHTLLSLAMYPYARAFHPWAVWAYAYLQAVTYLHFTLLAWPRLRTLPYRVLVSGPASFFAASILLSLPWAIAAGLDHPLPHAVVPFVLGAVGVMQSMTARCEHVHLHLDGSDTGALSRHPTLPKPAQEASAPLRVVQITDPHLGPFMSPSRLRRFCQRAVDAEPDLIVLTGDFLTMESQTGPEPLMHALAPLKGARGRVFACFGNHDHEAPELIRHALQTSGVELLVDEATCVNTQAGRVQILGADFRFRGRTSQLSGLAREFPREANSLRLWLLHDPGAFAHIPEGEADLVLSGHTHGGHVGLVSLGLPLTAVSLVTRMPDHGLWSRGRDRLYVHRGTGHYGFPLRLGVPAEESLLHVTRPKA